MQAREGEDEFEILQLERQDYLDQGLKLPELLMNEEELDQELEKDLDMRYY